MTKGAFPEHFNPHADKIWENDFLYHYKLSVQDCARFADVKIVLMGGSPNRMRKLAARVASQLGLPESNATAIGSEERFSLYKVGPVLISSHGMGQPSMSIALHEITKILVHAGVDITKVPYIRLGTCGGLNLQAVMTTFGVDGSLKSQYRAWVLGKEVVYQPLNFDAPIRNKMETIAKDLNIPYITGATCGTDCFYEGQGRIDGALCQYSEQDREDFLHRAYDAGVRNFEMESPAFAAFCNRLGIPVVCMCVAILNRFLGDQVSQLTESDLHKVEDYPGSLAIEYVMRHIVSL